MYSAKMSTLTAYIVLRKVSTSSAIQTFEVFYYFSQQIDRIWHNSWRLCIIPSACHVLLVLPYLRSGGTWVTCETHLLEIPGYDIPEMVVETAMFRELSPMTCQMPRRSDLGPR